MALHVQGCRNSIKVPSSQENWVEWEVYNALKENKSRGKACLGYRVMVRHTSEASSVPMPLAVRPWARVALIAASTEPADSTHYLLLASKKPLAELYEIFIQCVHFSSLFFFLFLFPTLAPLSLFSSATKQTRKTSLCHVFSSTSFLPRSTGVSR